MNNDKCKGPKHVELPRCSHTETDGAGSFQCYAVPMTGTRLCPQHTDDAFQYQCICILLRLKFGEIGTFPVGPQRAMILQGYVHCDGFFKHPELTDKGKQYLATLFAAGKDLLQHGL